MGTPQGGDRLAGDSWRKVLMTQQQGKGGGPGGRRGVEGALCRKEEPLGAWSACQVQLRSLPKSVGRPALQAGEP